MQVYNDVQLKGVTPKNGENGKEHNSLLILTDKQVRKHRYNCELTSPICNLVYDTQGASVVETNAQEHLWDVHCLKVQ